MEKRESRPNPAEHGNWSNRLILTRWQKPEGEMHKHPVRDRAKPNRLSPHSKSERRSLSPGKLAKPQQKQLQPLVECEDREYVSHASMIIGMIAEMDSECYHDRQHLHSQHLRMAPKTATYPAITPHCRSLASIRRCARVRALMPWGALH